MHENPAVDWRALAEHYRQMYDEELERLGEDFDTLTDPAKEVLRAEMKNRGLRDPGAPKPAPMRYDGQRYRSNASRQSSVFGSSVYGSAVDPDAAGLQSDASGDGEEPETGEPHEYTWWTFLCDCETEEAAFQLRAHLEKAGIRAAIQSPARSGISIALPRVVVAADELERAIEVAKQPIPQEILDDLKMEVPEYETPRCPACGAEDPTLEAAEPANSWLCEECGKQWTDPVPEEPNEGAA